MADEYTAEQWRVILNGGDAAADTDVLTHWQRYRHMPSILGGIITGPHMQNRTKPDKKEPVPVPDSGDSPPGIIGNPMDGGESHEVGMSGNPMDVGICHVSELPTPYPRDLTGPVVLELFEGLPVALQMEALALVEQLQRDRAFSQAFRADFYDAYAALTTPDRVAVLWALIYHPADVLARWKGMLRAA